MNVILFDGQCNFCNSSVQFVIKRDPKGYFSFASLQSSVGQELLKKHNIDNQTDSMVFIQGEHAFIKSTAALKICGHLEGGWKIIQLLLVIPSFLRNPFYDFIAKNRYKWFGKKDQCMLPSAEIRNRFID
ncbi:thiol-disulfide oxidoreductase DCC family protein [Litchfieldia alkalitelluris]|uniref:thiol-disulfide oxidoreductase DCC family protein n=1 Tax=Litchfieldia alkalitelluris TaxID=304268 RepID=UPI0009988027|nr:thiol-disulfide oxidoreductase DCC family protein [Litchfieldia alkalitelluris]